MKPAALVVLVVVGLLATGCAARDVVDPPAPVPADSTVRLVPEDRADLQLFVSNQSFEDDEVLVSVTIDGVELIARTFDVEGQHNWVLFSVELPPGRHDLEVTSDTGATLTETFRTPRSGVRHAVVDYWYYADDAQGRYFEWRIQDEPPAFD